ncbi:hypothetical protein HN873_017140 [Arachis hypogaea]
MREEEVASVATKPLLAGLGTSCNLNLFFSFTLFPHSNSLNATLSLLFNPKPHLFVTCSASSSVHLFFEVGLGEGNSDPLLVKAARGEPVSRPSRWMMHQAGRYMAIYRKLAKKYPSFRERSKTTDLIVEISLQPWNAFRPDGAFIFSDILTSLPAFGVEFDIEDVRGPVIQSPIRSEEGLKALHPIDLEKLSLLEIHSRYCARR